MTLAFLSVVLYCPPNMVTLEGRLTVDFEQNAVYMGSISILSQGLTSYFLSPYKKRWCLEQGDNLLLEWGKVEEDERKHTKTNTAS